MEWLLVLLLIPIFPVPACKLVKYSDLEKLGASCPPRDTCSNNAIRKFSDGNCECDNFCRYFDDCCIDAPPVRGQNRVERRPEIGCLPLNSPKGVYVIRKCSVSWNGSDVVRTKCETEEDLSDPLLSFPSTDTRTNVTYKNHYCAECNYASLDNLEVWDAELTCNPLLVVNDLFHNITDDFVKSNLARQGKSWGVYHWNGTLDEMSFYPCKVSFHLPTHLTPHIRYCRPNVISTCSVNWRQDLVRRRCMKYMAVISFGGQAYRNAHCALCNGISLNNPTCDSVLFRGPPSMSFTLLLDVNPSDGDKVGETESCPSGEKYDPFFQKCRELMCALPGHVFQNGRCVPQ